MNSRTLVACACIAILGGSSAACRTRLLTTDITASRPVAGSELIQGIPFRVRETHTIRVFQYHRPPPKPSPFDKRLVSTTGHFQQIYMTEVPFPNLSKLFALNFTTEGFTDHDFKLQYYPDGTIRKVYLKGTPNAEGAKMLATHGKTVADSALTLEDQIAKREHDLLTTERNRRQDQYSSLADLLDYQGKEQSLRDACMAWHAKAANATMAEREEVLRALRGQLALLMAAAAKIKQLIPVANPYGLSIEEICHLVNP